MMFYNFVTKASKFQVEVISTVTPNEMPKLLTPVWYRAPQYTMSNLWSTSAPHAEQTGLLYLLKSMDWFDLQAASKCGFLWHSHQRRLGFNPETVNILTFKAHLFFQSYLFGKNPSVEEIRYVLFKAKVCNDSECINNEAVFNVIEK